MSSSSHTQQALWLDPFRALGVAEQAQLGVAGLTVRPVNTLEELQAALDSEIFWRAHRSFVVNINRIREVMPWFKSTYQLKMEDKKGSEVPVSRLQSRRLREMLNL